MMKDKNKGPGRPHKYQNGKGTSIYIPQDLLEWSQREARACDLTWSEYIAQMLRREQTRKAIAGY